MSKEIREHIDKFNKFRLSENLNISDVISSLTLEDITKIVNAFTDINIPIEAVREEIELNYC
jgi:hypothetical protein